MPSLTPARAAVSAGLGSGYSIVLYRAFLDFFHHVDYLELVTIGIVAVGVIFFVEPLLNWTRGLVGFSEHEKSEKPRTKVFQFITVFLFIVASFSHALLHTQTGANPLGTLVELGFDFVGPAATTYTWLWRKQTSQPAAWAGGAVSALVGILFGLKHLIFVDASWSTVSTILVNIFQEAAYGLVGGLALDRGWGSSPGRGIIIGLLVAHVVTWSAFILVLSSLYAILMPPYVMRGFIFGVTGALSASVTVIGWAMGILILERGHTLDQNTSPGSRAA